MLTILSLLTLTIVTYIISDKLSHYTLLSRYTWYDNLAMKLYDYKGTFKSLLHKLYYFKLFTCRSCNVFWTALVTLTITHSFSEDVYVRNDIMNLTPEIVVTTSLIIFLIHKVENQDV